MVQRRFWIEKIEEAWKRRSVIWLSGVRRVGKTFLSQSLADIEYYDCELPRVRRLIEDPESFLHGLQGRRIVLDEIHRLTNPSEVLKIAADHYPKTLVLATGSSTFGASKKFRDTLTGRKDELWLTPMTTLIFKTLANRIFPVACCGEGSRLFCFPRNCRSGNFRNGSTPIGRKTSRSCFA